MEDWFFNLWKGQIASKLPVFISTENVAHVRRVLQTHLQIPEFTELSNAELFPESFNRKLPKGMHTVFDAFVRQVYMESTKDYKCENMEVAAMFKLINSDLTSLCSDTDQASVMRFLRTMATAVSFGDSTLTVSIHMSWSFNNIVKTAALPANVLVVQVGEAGMPWAPCKLCDVNIAQALSTGWFRGNRVTGHSTVGLFPDLKVNDNDTYNDCYGSAEIIVCSGRYMTLPVSENAQKLSEHIANIVRVFPQIRLRVLCNNTISQPGGPLNDVRLDFKRCFDSKYLSFVKTMEDLRERWDGAAETAVLSTLDGVPDDFTTENSTTSKNSTSAKMSMLNPVLEADSAALIGVGGGFESVRALVEAWFEQRRGNNKWEECIGALEYFAALRRSVEATLQELELDPTMMTEFLKGIWWRQRKPYSVWNGFLPGSGTGPDPTEKILQTMVTALKDGKYEISDNELLEPATALGLAHKRRALLARENARLDGAKAPTSLYEVFIRQAYMEWSRDYENNPSIEYMFATLKNNGFLTTLYGEQERFLRNLSTAVICPDSILVLSIVLHGTTGVLCTLDPPKAVTPVNVLLLQAGEAGLYAWGWESSRCYLGSIQEALERKRDTSGINMLIGYRSRHDLFPTLNIAPDIKYDDTLLQMDPSTPVVVCNGATPLQALVNSAIFNDLDEVAGESIATAWLSSVLRRVAVKFPQLKLVVYSHSCRVFDLNHNGRTVLYLQFKVFKTSVTTFFDEFYQNADAKTCFQRFLKTNYVIKQILDDSIGKALKKVGYASFDEMVENVADKRLLYPVLTAFFAELNINVVWALQHLADNPDAYSAYNAGKWKPPTERKFEPPPPPPSDVTHAKPGRGHLKREFGVYDWGGGAARSKAGVAALALLVAALWGVS